MTRQGSHLKSIGAVAFTCLLFAGNSWSPAVGQTSVNPLLPTLGIPAQHDISLPLTDYPKREASGGFTVLPWRKGPLSGANAVSVSPEKSTGLVKTVPKSEVQPSGSTPSTQPGVDFEGLGSSGYIPPDPNIAVGLNYIVEGVNVEFAVYDKQGTLISVVYPWSGFGNPCETVPGGDTIVQYDKSADRWVISQIANNFGPTYYFCFAVSTSNDPTGSYSRYAYTFGNLPDFPKVAVWPSGYFVSFNMFQNGSTFLGAQTCAYDRDAMLAGSPSAASECFQLATSYMSLLPSDFDGPNAPPANSPNYFISDYGQSAALSLWQFIPNFSNPSTTDFSGPTTINTNSFTEPCDNCVPQLGTSQQLETLGDRLNYRLAYRNFGSYESLVVNRAESINSTVGIRWYEIRNPGSSAYIFQQGDLSPDSQDRWMGSIAMDGIGNIGLGYSLSSSTSYPSIAYAGHRPTDSAGQMGAETVALAGTSYQTSYARWGDYSAMRIDPSDDATFWYANEYYKSPGTAWATHISSFRFTAPAPNPWQISVTKPNPTCYDNNAEFTVTLNQQNAGDSLNWQSQLVVSSFIQASFNWTLSDDQGQLSNGYLYSDGGGTGPNLVTYGPYLFTVPRIPVGTPTMFVTGNFLDNLNGCYQQVRESGTGTR